MQSVSLSAKKKLPNVQNEVFLTDLVFQKEFLGCSFIKFQVPLAFPNLALDGADKKSNLFEQLEKIAKPVTFESENPTTAFPHTPQRGSMDSSFKGYVSETSVGRGASRLLVFHTSTSTTTNYQPTLRGIPNAVDWNLVNDTVKTDFVS